MKENVKIKYANHPYRLKEKDQFPSMVGKKQTENHMGSKGYVLIHFKL